MKDRTLIKKYLEVATNDSTYGKQVELLIQSILPEAELASSYDILWDGIKIEVRSSRVKMSNRWRFRSTNRHDSDAIVCIATERSKIHAWVVPTNQIKTTELILDADSQWYTNIENIPEKLQQIERFDPKKATKEKNTLFTAAVTKIQWEWLRNQGFNTRKSKAKIIRELITKAMKGGE